MVRAPEIDRPDVEWLNTSSPLSLEALRGRLVLLDFWTSGCINCLHIVPLLHKLEQEFTDKLIIIGVHSPKFTRERDLVQLKETAKRYHIYHPIIQDPDRRLWDEYTIRAWPTVVLILVTGFTLSKSQKQGNLTIQSIQLSGFSVYSAVKTGWFSLYSQSSLDGSRHKQSTNNRIQLRSERICDLE